MYVLVMSGQFPKNSTDKRHWPLFRGSNPGCQMVYFPDGAPNGEKTAANGAPPHFRIERNFLWLHSCFLIFLEVPFDWFSVN